MPFDPQQSLMELRRSVEGASPRPMDVFDPMQSLAELAMPMGQGVFSPADSLQELRRHVSARAAYDQPIGEAPGWFGALTNAFQRGYQTARIGKNVAEAPLFGIQAEDIAEAAAARQNLPTSEAYERYNQSEGWWETLTNAIPALPEIIAEATGTFLPVAPVIGGATLGGMAAGSAIPGAGTAGGGIVAGSAAAGVTSGVIEAANKIIESFQEARVDVTDPKALRAAFEDERAYEEIKSNAIKKGVAIGIFDAVSFAIGGRLWSRPAGSVARQLGRAAGEAGIQATSGAGGEFFGEVLSGEEISPPSIVAEALGEIGPGLAQAGMAAGVRGPAARRMAERTRMLTEAPPTEVTGYDREAEGRVARPKRVEGQAGPTEELGRAVQEPSIGAEEAPAGGVLQAREEVAAEGRLSFTGWSTPVKGGMEQLADIQASMLPAGRFIALDKPFESAAHDASRASPVSVSDLRVFDPDGLLNEETAEQHSQIVEEWVRTANALPPDSDIRSSFTTFLQDKGFDAYIRGIDGDPANRELIVFDPARVREGVLGEEATGITAPPSPTAVPIIREGAPTQQVADVAERKPLDVEQDLAEPELVKYPGMLQRTVNAVKKLGNFPTQWIDTLTPLFHTDRMLWKAKGRALDPMESGGEVGTFFNKIAPAVGKQWVEIQPIDPWVGQPIMVKDLETGEQVPLRSMKKIVQDGEKKSGLKSKEFDRILGNYMWARRAQSRYFPNDLDPGITVEQAQRFREQGDATPGVKEASDGLLQWWEGFLRQYVQVLTPEMTGMFDRFLQYEWFPLARVHPDDEIRAQMNRADRATGIRSFARVRGGEQPVRDILPQIQVHMHRMIRAAHHGAVKNALMQNKDILLAEGVIVKESPKWTPAMVALRKAVDQAKEAGVELDIDMGPIIGQMMADKYGKGDMPVVQVLEDGKIAHYRFTDPKLYKSIYGIDVWRLPKVLDMTLGATARAMRIGTTGLRPAFSVITNPQRDIQTFFMQTQSHAAPEELAAAWLWAAKEALLNRGGEPVKLFYRLAGHYGQPLGVDIAATSKETRNLLSKNPLAYGLSGVMNKIRDVLSIPEEIPRIAEMMLVAKEVGYDLKADGTLPPMTPNQAIRIMNAAHRVTVDFRAMGSLGQIANTVIPFFNANIQGARLFTRRWKEDPSRTALYGLSMLTLPTLALWASNADKDWYKDKSPAEKYFYWHIPIPGTDEIVKVPRAFEWGNMFSVIPEALFDAWHKKDPQAVKDALSYVLETTAPIDTADPMKWPYLLRIYTEQQQNYLDFFDRPIVPAGEEYLPPEEQRGPYTTAFAQSVAYALPDWFPDKWRSPRRIDVAVRQVFGGVGPDILQGVIDPALAVFGLEREPERGTQTEREGEWADIPVIGRQFQAGGRAGISSRAINDLYKLRSELLTRSRSQDRPETDEQEDYRYKVELAISSIGALRKHMKRQKDRPERAETLDAMRQIAMNTLDVGKTLDLDAAAEPQAGTTAERAALRRIDERRSILRQQLADDYVADNPEASADEIRQHLSSHPRLRSITTQRSRVREAFAAGRTDLAESAVQSIESGQVTNEQARTEIREAWLSNRDDAKALGEHYYGSWSAAIRNIWGSASEFQRDVRSAQRMSNRNLPPDLQDRLRSLAFAQSVGEMPTRDAQRAARQAVEGAGLRWTQVHTLFNSMVNQQRRSESRSRLVSQGVSQ